jgi:effector-binding domain-containing protein
MADVVFLTAPARPTAVLAAHTTWAEYPRVWGPLLDRVHAGVTWHGAGMHKGRNVMLYLDDDPHVEVGVELDQPVDVDPSLLRSQLPAGPVAMCVHRGGYATLSDAYEAINAACQEQGREKLGPHWEIYGHPDAADHVDVEIWYLLAP